MKTPTIVTGRYALQEPARPGGMADVYPAVDITNGKKVAVKLFRQGLSQNDIAKEVFSRETTALKELTHPSIVELIGEGTDEATGRPFLILEWMETDLSELLKKSPPANWDRFYEDIGRPLLDAIAFAHTRHIAHRDVKTKNVLVNGSRVIKLADFGIAKFKKLIDPTITLSDFVSRPFAPPEPDSGDFTYTRDVFAFAVVALHALSEDTLHTHDDVVSALDSCNLPDSVHATLSLALSEDPAMRQVNGAVLLSALDQIAQERHSGSENREVLFLQVHDSLFRKAKALFQVNDIRSVESLIQSDIDEVCGVIRSNGAESAESEVNFKMFGASCGYDVSVHPDSDSYLVISNLWRSPPSMLERYRDDAFSGPFRFQFGYPPQMFEGRQSILRFHIALDQFLTELAIKQQERAEQELFRGWGNTLRAKSDLERLREKPIQYRRVLEDSGATVTFELVDVPSEDLVGQPRQIRQHGVTYVTGDVESVEGAKLILRVERLYSNDFPEQGELLIDRFAANAAIECQRRALDAVRYDRALRTELKRFLVRPEKCSQPEEVGDIEFVQNEMDDIKKDSVKAALGAKDFLLVSGPPGTGKTTFIAELIIQTVRSNPHARVLLTSQTHVALDNAVERLLGLQSGLKIVRVGRIEDPRISQSVKSLILENQMESWRKEVLTRGRSFLEKFAAENGISKRNAEIAVSLQTLISLENSITGVESLVRVRTEETTQLKERDDGAQSAALEEVDAELNRLRGELLLLKRERRTLHKRLGELDPITQELFDRPSTELEEWNKTFLPDTAENRRFRDMLQIQADWELRFGRGTEFHAALLTSAQVIAGTCVGIASVRAIQEVEFDLCIVDEASKATPTETLVPLSRSRRWIMVGDQRQLPPFVEQELEANDLLSKYDLTAEELKKTVFDRLHSLLPQSCRKALLVQYRMVREIGDLISECFYGGEVKSSGRKHDSVLLDVLAKPVTWIDTSRLPHRFESQSGTARMNTCEVRVVTDLLAKLNRSAGMKKRTYTVAVLSGYVLQKSALERAIAQRAAQLQYLTVEANTVDAFQGREADLTIYSVTRSNANRKIGFLSEDRRLNVALSRGKYYLVLIGDLTFARNAVGVNPFIPVIRHIESHPTDCAIRNANL